MFYFLLVYTGVGDRMFYIKEGNNNITTSEIIVKDFLYLTKSDEYIIKKMIEEDSIIKAINFPENIINEIVNIIVNNLY